ncbi:hypothetical protein L195_g004827 [Trifolium pratense]|uniref:DUF4220 domain-containing protein n=1 Tax=Trifolium pratense TaxID=57577 RepID=A0A2K3NZ49_TRIPR|nr:hypothetical protein L195_g004827 [Trifolium pratense]
MQIFPQSLQNFWYNWELQFMVVFSLSIQIILLLFGNRRKFCTRIYLRITIWSAFLFADWFAATSLGILSNKEGENKSDSVESGHVIVALWGPVLLLHLGGQDTVTAYSMEDNALWSRRLVTYVGQVVVAILIFLRSWTNTDLNILAIPIFIAGFIKIGERIWVLWCASSQQFKESLFPDPDPGPNYARYMETYNSAFYEGYVVHVEGLIETPSNGDVDHTHAASQGNINIISLPQTDDTYGPPITVRTAYKFLKISKLLFADLILSFQDVSESRSSLLSGNGKEGFEVMEIELGFMYDVFYTKAVLVYSVMGCFLRFVTFTCSISVLCSFFVMEKNQYPGVDVFITSVLLLGAIIFEICSIVLVLSSDWTMMWLSMHKNKVTSKVISLLQSVKNKRWCCSIDQFNLISFCLMEAMKKRNSSTLGKTLRVEFGSNYGKTLKKIVAKCGIAQMIIGVCKSYQKYEHTNTKIVTGDLKEIIFEHFVNKINEVINLEEGELAKNITRICEHRGNKVLEGLESELMLQIKDKEKVEKIIRKLSWSVEIEFDQSILLWHIATNLCYNSSISGDEILENGRSYRETSKLLSEYMLYLLIMRPSMLPNGIGEISFQDTCAEATEFVKDRHSIQHEKHVYEMLHKLVNRDIDKVSPSKVKGDRSKSVLFDAFRLAKNIVEIENDNKEWKTKKMWKFITQVWVEMLAYAASHCQVIHHAQQLRHGGELLTHVWLLMAHLGITDRLQISKGFGRAKLIKK